MNITVPMRARLALLAIAALIIAITTALPAHAAAESDLPAAWDLDNGVPAATASMKSDLYGSVKELGPKNGNSTKIENIKYAGLPVLSYTNPNAGTDLTAVYWDAALVDGDLWGYFAFYIESFSTGQSAWEFMAADAPAACNYNDEDPTPEELASDVDDCNPWANRAEDDFLIVADYEGNDVTVQVRKWAGPDNALTLVNEDLADGNWFGYADINGSGLVEIAVNMTEEVFGGELSCASLANVIPSTVTGNSDSADYKDAVLERIIFQTCGSVKIDKVLAPDGVSRGDDVFTWTLDRNDDSNIKYGGPTSASDTIYEPAGEGYDTDDLVIDVLPGTNYFLDEAIGTGGDGLASFEKKTIVCAVPGGSTYKLYDRDADDEVAAFPVVVGKTTTCTITNELRKGTLKVYKTVVNDSGLSTTASGFQVDITGPNSYSKQNQQFGDENPSDGNALTGYLEYTVDSGTYTVVEDAVTGYTTTYTGGDCNAVVVPPGGVGSCYITNDDQKASPGATTAQSWVLHDSVTFTGVRAGAPDAPTQVTFGLFTDASCTVAVTGGVGFNHQEVVTLNADETAATVNGIAVSAPGTFYWKVTRAADAYNNAVSYCNETTTITADDDVAGG